MGRVHVVNMIPASLSGETNQDSEPSIAVNPEQTSHIVGTAFTPSPLGGDFAPLYVSLDGGVTWTLHTVVPGNGPAGTSDISVGFATSGGILYAGTINGDSLHMQILRMPDITSASPMTVLVDRASDDQPWVVAGSVVVSNVSKDRVYVGNNDFNQPSGGTSTLDFSLDAATAASPANFSPLQLERRATLGQDGPSVRTTLHSDGTVYAAFPRWVSGSIPDVTIDIVVTRDDEWGSSAPPFSALTDTSDGGVGQRVATGRFIRFNAIMGQERLGADLSIAADPSDSNTVWIAWCDRVGGAAGTDWTLHVVRSTDRGQTWSADLRTITNVKNPSLAVNSNRLLGLAYQLYSGTSWITQLELTANAWATAAETHVLHQASADTPTRDFLPYIGDYIRLLAVGTDFYGVFSGNNTPDMANFPSGIVYQRRANWTTHVLLDNDGVTPVQPSIDPFFYHWSELIFPPIGPIGPPIVPRGPITPEPVIPRGPIIPEPPEPIAPPPEPGASKKPRRGRPRRRSSSPQPPTDIEL